MVISIVAGKLYFTAKLADIEVYSFISNFCVPVLNELIVAPLPNILISRFAEFVYTAKVAKV